MECDLAENHKKIKMLNSGTKDLDHIFSMGQLAKVNWRQGYQGAAGTDEVHEKDTSCEGAHQKVKARKFFMKYVETYPKTFDRKFYSIEL